MLINIKTVYAASSISFSSSSPKVGESLRVTVSVPNVNTVDLKATVSGCGTNGTIQIVDVSMTGNPKTFSGSVTVTPTSTGTITVAISDSSNAVLNGSYVSVGGSRTITVSNKQSSSNSSSSSSNNSTSSSNSSNGSTSSNNSSNPIEFQAYHILTRIQTATYMLEFFFKHTANQPVIALPFSYAFDIPFYFLSLF